MAEDPNIEDLGNIYSEQKVQFMSGSRTRESYSATNVSITPIPPSPSMAATGLSTSSTFVPQSTIANRNKSHHNHSPARSIAITVSDGSAFGAEKKPSSPTKPTIISRQSKTSPVRLHTTEQWVPEATPLTGHDSSDREPSATSIPQLVSAGDDGDKTPPPKLTDERPSMKAALEREEAIINYPSGSVWVKRTQSAAVADSLLSQNWTALPSELGVPSEQTNVVRTVLPTGGIAGSSTFDPSAWQRRRSPPRSDSVTKDAAVSHRHPPVVSDYSSAKPLLTSVPRTPKEPEDSICVSSSSEGAIAILKSSRALQAIPAPKLFGSVTTSSHVSAIGKRSTVSGVPLPPSASTGELLVLKKAELTSAQGMQSIGSVAKSKPGLKQPRVASVVPPNMNNFLQNRPSTTDSITKEGSKQPNRIISNPSATAIRSKFSTLLPTPKELRTKGFDLQSELYPMLVTIPATALEEIAGPEVSSYRRNSNVITDPSSSNRTALVTSKDLLAGISDLLSDPKHKASTDAQWRALLLTHINAHNAAVRERRGTKGRYALNVRVEGVEEDDDGRLFYAMIPSPSGSESSDAEGTKRSDITSDTSSSGQECAQALTSMASTTFLTEADMAAARGSSMKMKKSSSIRDPYTHHRTQRRQRRTAEKEAAEALEGSKNPTGSVRAESSRKGLVLSAPHSVLSGSTALSKTASRQSAPVVTLTPNEIFKQRVGRLRRYVAHQLKRRDEIMERAPTELQAVQSRDQSEAKTLDDTANRILAIFSNEMVSDDDDEETEGAGTTNATNKSSSRRTSAEGTGKKPQRYSMQAREFMNLGPRRGQVTSETATSNYETIIKILTQEDYDFTKPYVSPEQQAELVRSQSEGTLYEGPFAARARRRSSRRRSSVNSTGKQNTATSSSSSLSGENTEDDLANEDLDDYDLAQRRERRRKRKERRRRNKERRKRRMSRKASDGTEGGGNDEDDGSSFDSEASDSLFAMSGLKMNVGISPELAAQRRRRRLSKRKSWRSVEGGGGSISHERLHMPAGEEDGEASDEGDAQQRANNRSMSYASNSSNNPNYGIYVSKSQGPPRPASTGVGDEQRFAARLKLLSEREKAAAAGAGGHRSSFGEGRASRASKAGSSPGAANLSAPATPNTLSGRNNSQRALFGFDIAADVRVEVMELFDGRFHYGDDETFELISDYDHTTTGNASFSSVSQPNLGNTTSSASRLLDTTDNNRIGSGDLSGSGPILSRKGSSKGLPPRPEVEKLDAPSSTKVGSKKEKRASDVRPGLEGYGIHLHNSSTEEVGMILDLDHLQGMFEITELLNGADYVNKEEHPMRIHVQAPAGARLEIARVRQEVTGEEDEGPDGKGGRKRIGAKKGMSLSTPQSRRQSVQLFAKIKGTVITGGVSSPIHLAAVKSSAISKPSSADKPIARLRSGSGDMKSRGSPVHSLKASPTPPNVAAIPAPPPHHRASPTSQMGNSTDNPFLNTSTTSHPIHTGTLVRPTSSSVRSLLAGSIDNGAPTITMGLGRGKKRAGGNADGSPPPSPRRATRVPKPPARMLVNHSAANFAPVKKGSGKNGPPSPQSRKKVKTNPSTQSPSKADEIEGSIPQSPTRAPSAFDGSGAIDGEEPMEAQSHDENAAVAEEPLLDETSRSTPPPSRSIAPLTQEDLAKDGEGEDGAAAGWSPTIPWIAGGGHYYAEDSRRAEWETGEGWVEHYNDPSGSSRRSRRSSMKRSPAVSSATSAQRQNRKGTHASGSLHTSPLRNSVDGANGELIGSSSQQGIRNGSLSTGPITVPDGTTVQGMLSSPAMDGDGLNKSGRGAKRRSTYIHGAATDRSKGEVDKADGNDLSASGRRRTAADNKGGWASTQGRGGVASEPSHGEGACGPDGNANSRSSHKGGPSMDNSMRRWREGSGDANNDSNSGRDSGRASWEARGGAWTSGDAAPLGEVTSSTNRGSIISGYAAPNAWGGGLGLVGFGPAPPRAATKESEGAKPSSEGTVSKDAKGKKPHGSSTSQSSKTKGSFNKGTSNNIGFESTADQQPSAPSAFAPTSPSRGPGRRTTFALSPTVTGAKNREGVPAVDDHPSMTANGGQPKLTVSARTNSVTSADAAVRKAVMMAYRNYSDTKHGKPVAQEDTAVVSPMEKAPPPIARGPVPFGVAKGRAVTTPLTSSSVDVSVPLPPLNAKIRGHSASGGGVADSREPTSLPTMTPAAQQFQLPTTTRASAISYYANYPTDAPVEERKNALVRALLMAASMRPKRTQRPSLLSGSEDGNPSSSGMPDIRAPKPPSGPPDVAAPKVLVRGSRGPVRKWGMSVYTPKERQLSPITEALNFPIMPESNAVAAAPKTMLDRLADLLIQGSGAGLDPLIDALMAADSLGDTTQDPKTIHQVVTQQLLAAVLEQNRTSTTNLLVSGAEEAGQSSQTLLQQCEVLIRRNPQIYDEVINDVADILRDRIGHRGDAFNEGGTNADGVASSTQVNVPIATKRKTGPNSPPRVTSKPPNTFRFGNNTKAANSNSAAKSNPSNDTVVIPKGNYRSVLDELMDMATFTGPSAELRRAYFEETSARTVVGKDEPHTDAECEEDESSTDTHAYALKLMEQEDRLRQAASNWAAKIIERRAGDPSFAAALRDANSAMHQVVTAVSQQLRMRRQINLEKLMNVMHRKLGDKGWFPSYSNENVYLTADLIAGTDDFENDGYDATGAHVRPSGRVQFNFATGPVAKQGRLKGFGPHNWVDTSALAIGSNAGVHPSHGSTSKVNHSKQFAFSLFEMNVL